MEEYILAIIVTIILYWHFNINTMNNCIVMNNCNPNIKVKHYQLD